MATGISYLDQITPEKDDWKIRVRVIRLWRQHAYMNPMETMSLDMVLMDEEGDKIHATVKKHLLMKFEPLLQEGSVYVISNFGVAENASGFKMVRHSYRINFYRMTLVKAYTSQFVGSRYGLDFKQFDDILTEPLDLNNACDVIGLITGSDGFSVTTNGGKCVKRMAFQLTDIGGATVNCTLWGELAQELADYIENMAIAVHVILIIQLGRVRSWNEKPNVSNCYFGTRLLINSETSEISDFKARLSDTPFGTHVPALKSKNMHSTFDAFVSGSERKRVDEIREIKKAGKYLVMGTIVCVQKDQDWYYLACRKCRKGVEADEAIDGKEVWVCRKCNKNGVDVVHRFKVQVRVQDNTGSVSFVLFDELVRNLIEKSAYELLTEIPAGYEDDYYPDELNELVGKKFLFKADVDDLNIKRNSRVYTVSKMTDDEQLLAKFVNNDGMGDANKSDETSSSTAPKTPTCNGKRRLGMLGISDDVQPSATKAKLMPTKARKI